MIEKTLEERVEVLEKLTVGMAIKMLEKFGTPEMIDNVYNEFKDIVDKLEEGK